ncbi:MAG: hypothetical protein NTV09_10525 [Bacteroidetes bacterium]|nr:hypothetical protein [Bacteroidota bacterium]
MAYRGKKKNSNSKFREPQTDYGRLGIFQSFEEMNEADAEELAKYTPEQHLVHATSLIQRIYADELKRKFTVGRVYFK